MDHPSSRFRLVPRLGVLGLCLLGTLSHPPAAPAATAPEVCQSDTTPRDADWTCASPGPTRTIFWVPRCTPGNLSARVPAPGLTFVLLNTDRTRMLSAFGHATGADILVGSPSTSDVLAGQGGSNTYVMGGLNGFLLGINDRAFIVSTSSESDWADLTTRAAEYVYINATGQGGASSIPTAASPGVNVNVRGSNELSSFPFARCESVGLKLLAAPQDGEPGRQPSPVAGATADCRDCPLPGKPERRTPFPGSPTLRGFVIGPASEHRILLPANDFLFLGRSLQGRKEIPMLLVDEVRFSPTQGVVGREQYEGLRRRAKGLGKLASKEAPLVYFRQNGLLVFSQNGEPLGSTANPGLVIARLLDRNGRPLQIQASGNPRLFQARFLSFTPPQSNLYTNPPR